LLTDLLLILLIMNTVFSERLGRGKDVSSGGQGVEIGSEREHDRSILIDVEHEYSPSGSNFFVVKLFGEELKQLLKGHRFCMGRGRSDDPVRRF
jgi:hypothetical protein